MLKSNQIEVIRTILYAVETGGQVYGMHDYSDFTEAYTNSVDEHAITIGAGQWYGPEAQTLLKNIYIANPSLWQAYDSIGLYDDVLYEDWSCYNIIRSSQKAKLIITLISSPIGVICQNALMDDQIRTYAEAVEKKGVSDIKAIAMCINFRHQGGPGAVTRILGKAEKPYTLDSLYVACKSDTGNQVGVYRQRQEFVLNSINQYMEDTVMGKVEKAVAFMEAIARDPAHGYDQIYRWGEKGDYDCSSLVITAYQQAGVPVKEKGATYTGNMLEVFLACGFEDVTSKVNLATGEGMKRGDVLLNTVHHTALYCGSGMEVEASINEKGGATGGQPGDQTGREILIRSYRNYPWNHVLRLKDEEKPKRTMTKCSVKLPVLKQGMTGDDVAVMQSLVGAEADGEYGPMTFAQVKKYKQTHGFDNANSTVGAKMWSGLLDDWING